MRKKKQQYVSIITCHIGNLPRKARFNMNSDNQAEEKKKKNSKTRVTKKGDNTLVQKVLTLMKYKKEQEESNFFTKQINKIATSIEKMKFKK